MDEPKIGAYTLVFQCDACKRLRKYNHFKPEHNPDYSVRRICKDCYYGATKDEYRNFSPEINKIFNSIKHGARARKIEFRITRDTIKKHHKAPCNYCGLESTGLDRVDSSRGYTPSNVVPCCKLCNTTKLQQTPDEFIEHCIRIVEHSGYHIYDKKEGQN